MRFCWRDYLHIESESLSASVRVLTEIAYSPNPFDARNRVNDFVLSILFLRLSPESLRPGPEFGTRNYCTPVRGLYGRWLSVSSGMLKLRALLGCKTRADERAALANRINRISYYRLASGPQVATKRTIPCPKLRVNTYFGKLRKK